MRVWILVVLMACAPTEPADEVASGDDSPVEEPAPVDEPAPPAEEPAPPVEEPASPVEEHAPPVEEPPIEEAPVAQPPAQPIQTPSNATRRSCAQANPDHHGCQWAVEEQAVCQGIRAQPGVPPPTPRRVCVCHQCRRDRDCRDQPEGTCGTVPATCSNTVRRVCVYDDPCVVCPAGCGVRTDPTTGQRTAICQRPAPPPSSRR